MACFRLLMFSTSYTWKAEAKYQEKIKVQQICCSGVETNLALLLFPLFISAVEMKPDSDENYHGFVYLKVVLHLSSIDEVENLLHEVVQKDCLAEAKAEVPDSIER